MGDLVQADPAGWRCQSIRAADRRRSEVLVIAEREVPEEGVKLVPEEENVVGEQGCVSAPITHP